MPSKIMKKGRVVIVLRGRQAGKKGVIVKTTDKEAGNRSFGTALIAGIEIAPRRVLHRHTKKQISYKTRVKPFIKSVNYQHLFPTRYTFDQDLSLVRGISEANDVARRKKLKRRIKAIFEARHKEGKNKWFFSKLKF